MGDHLGTPCADGMDSDIDADQKQVTGVSLSYWYLSQVERL